mgnify:CR=1 FL=1
MDPNLVGALVSFAALIVFVWWGIPAILRHVAGDEPTAQQARSNFRAINGGKK